MHPPPAPDRRRITEQDADFQRIHGLVARALRAGVWAYVRELRLGRASEQDAAASRFIARQMATLRRAWLAGFWEGQRDYWNAHSAKRSPQGHGALSAAHGVTVPEAKVRRALVYYGAASVTKMAREGAQSAQRERHATIPTPRTRQTRQATTLPAQRLADPPPTLDAWASGLSARIDMQAAISWSGMQDGYLAAGTVDPANPYGYVWWTVEPSAQHCSDCPSLAADSPYTAPGAGGHELLQTPGDGLTECGGGCKCSLQYGSDGSEMAASGPFTPDEAAMETAWQAGLPGVGTPATPAVRPVNSVNPDGSRVGVTPARAFPQGTPGVERAPALAIPSAQGGQALTAGQQVALDAFRVAARAWEPVRGDLPDLTLFLDQDELPIEEADPWASIAWDDLTAEQQTVVSQALEAMIAWSDATPLPFDEDADYLREPEGGAYQLFNPNHDGRGRFAPGGAGGRRGEHASRAGDAHRAQAHAYLAQAHLALQAGNTREGNERIALGNVERMLGERADAVEAGRLPEYHADLGSLAAAKTTGEVDQWMRDNFPTVKSGWEDADLEQARGACAELARFSQEYPTAIGELRYFGAATSPELTNELLAHGSMVQRLAAYENDGVGASYFTPAHGILFTPYGLSGNGTGGRADYNEAVRTNWLIGTKDEQGASNARHELGHHVVTLLDESPRPGARGARTYVNEARLLSPAAGLSTYAAENGAEHWAEGFAALTRGSAGQRGLEFVQRLQRVIRAYVW